MRPMRLVAQAFGPYATELVLDFRDLGDRTLFLIHGPTGAGKTSILDAICFALYGVCSGGHREAKQARSDHADPSVPTEVTFDFSLASELYRVYRKPEQVRIRKKDGRSTTTRPEAELFRRTGLQSEAEEGMVLATQWKRVTEEIERLIGFRSDQFRQVVMLPQGEFRRLLLADSKDRQAILEVLFGTELYRRIEEALKQAAREVEIQAKAAEQRLKFILEQAGAETLQQLMDQQTEIQSRHAAVQHHLNGFKKADEQAREKLNQGRAAIEKLKELDLAKKALVEYENQVEAIRTKRESLGAARQAAVLEPEEKALAVRSKEADEASRHLTKEREGLALAESDKEKAQERLSREEQQQPIIEQLRGELGRIEGLTPSVQELDKLKKKASAAGREFFAKDQALEGAKGALEQYRSDMEKVLPQREQVEKIAARGEFLQLKVRELEQAHQVHTRLRALGEDEVRETDTLQETCLKLNRAETELGNALDEYKRLESEWIEGQAAILAARLVPGTPCPVCGSKNHPTPASVEHEPPNEKLLKTKAAQVDRLRSRVEQIRQEKTQIEIRLSQIRADSEARKEGLGDFASRAIDEIETELETFRKDLKSAEAARKKAEDLTKKIQRLESAISEATQTHSVAEQQRNESMMGLQKLQSEFTALKGQLPEDLQEIEALERAITEKRKRINALEQAFQGATQAAARTNERVHACQAALKAAEDHSTACSQRVLVQREEFGRNLLQAGFPDDSTFRSAIRSPVEIGSLEKVIESFDRGISAARDRLNRARLNAEEVPQPDMEELEKSAEQARVDLETTLREDATLAAGLKRVNQWLSEHAASSETVRSLEEKYSVIGRIAQAANGVNKDGITFQRFVLAALLDDVLFAASKRFRIMTNNRFHLQRVAKRADRRVPGGLDLEVHDTYTGSARAVNTLSGGESFLASLSLALGLADVVQGYAGGIHLDTMFVDEGFGSLDPEALDLALRALMDLRQEGRLVGIISHVPELTERIDARLEVTSGRNGSSARFVV
jgi:DNA repair protein SbcC/Rad50